ncbi:MAG: hypothetical protein ACKO38_01435 [Planctomycetota bacterium]
MKKALILWCLLLAASATTVSAAELGLASVFSDHMVLQRDKPVKIWGKTEPNTRVSVAFAEQTKTATSTADGTWTAILDPIAASSQPRELTVTSVDRSVKISDVLVGEVWLLGGQSNMEMPLWWRGDSDGLQNAKDTRLVIGTDHPWLRIMTVPQQVSRQPQDDFVPGNRDGDGVVTGRWFVAEDKHPAISGFSALGYFIAFQLHEKLGVPIGLIDTSWGGTIAAAWNSRASLETIPEAAEMIHKKEAAAAAWTEDGARLQLAAELRDWEIRAAAAKSANKPLPGKPSLKPDPGQDRNFPAGPFNAMIWPLRHLAMRGVFFYQGENNYFDKEDPFAKTFPGVVHSWRQTFGESQLPFCIFQICGWDNADRLYHPTRLPIIQEQQHKAHLAIPATGFVVTMDYPHVDIHPMVKRVIAERALRWARAEVYGEKGLTWGSPTLESAKREGTQMLLAFRTSANEALLIKGEPSGLVIAGSDGKFVPAQAKIVRRTSLAVWSDEVPEPMMVRYAWSQRAVCRLFSASGLPVGPFRTDTDEIPASQIRD